MLYPLSANESYSTESKTVGHKVTALKCEIEGIALGLEVDYLKLNCPFNIVQYLYIMSCVTARRLLPQFPCPMSMR